jgi:hypothetical protein
MKDLRASPFSLMIGGGLLLVIGAVLPFLMVTRIIESTLVLNFVSAIATFLGMMIGFFGLFEYHKAGKRGGDG